MKISVFSITSLLISIVAFVLYAMLLDGTNVYVPWIVLSVLAMFFPLLSKYFRKRNSKRGNGFEITALVIGAFDFYFVFFAATQINLFLVFVMIGIICFMYAKLFNNIVPIEQKNNTYIVQNNPIPTNTPKEEPRQLSLDPLENSDTSEVELSDAEWEHLYKTNYEKFWEMVVIEYGPSNLPNHLINMRNDQPLYGADARNCYLARLKGVVYPRESHCDIQWSNLLEIQHELKKKNQPSSMLDAIREYEHRYIKY